MPAFNSSTFADFLVGTRNSYLADGKVINLTGYQSHMFDDFLKGKADGEVIQGGKEITVNLQVSSGPVGGHVHPGAEVNRTHVNGLTTATTGWRFWFGSWGYTGQEIELNKQEQVVNLATHKRAMFRQSMHETFESYLWATPNAAAMEGVGALSPYSIPCFITDDGALPSGFSTLMNYNWALGGNQVETYTAADLDTLLKRFETMQRKLDWSASGASAAWTDQTKWNKFTIATNGAGSDQIAELIRDYQGGNIMVQTGAGDLGAVSAARMWNGIPIKYIPYTDGLSWANPKYYWINTQYMHPVFHSTVYQREKDPKEVQNQPNTYYVDNDTWWNFVGTARHRHGIVLAG
jgi:hypothetical protein